MEVLSVGIMYRSPAMKRLARKKRGTRPASPNPQTMVGRVCNRGGHRTNDQSQPTNRIRILKGSFQGKMFTSINGIESSPLIRGDR